jgi:hypothetical protein
MAPGRGVDGRAGQARDDQTLVCPRVAQRKAPRLVDLHRHSGQRKDASTPSNEDVHGPGEEPSDVAELEDGQPTQGRRAGGAEQDRPQLLAPGQWTVVGADDVVVEVLPSVGRDVVEQRGDRNARGVQLAAGRDAVLPAQQLGQSGMRG